MKWAKDKATEMLSNGTMVIDVARNVSHNYKNRIYYKNLSDLLHQGRIEEGRKLTVDFS